MSGPGTKTQPVCVNCLDDWNGKNVCADCGWPVCDQPCQGGENHIIECETLSKCPPEKRPDFKKCLDGRSCLQYAAILPLRISLLAKRSVSRERLELLMDHREDIVKQHNYEEKWDEPVVKYLTESFESNMTKDEVLRGIGIFCTNAAYMGHKNGRWLLPTFSFLSHSCVCNSRFFISPQGGVVVRAQSPIKAGEEITISYFPTARGNILRRQTYFL